MNIPFKKSLWLAGVVLLGLAATFVDKSAPLSLASERLEATQKFQETALRGYGKISGTEWRAAEGGSILQIDCENEAHAKLTQAKYLSDLSLLPGVSESQVRVRGVSISAREVERQGCLSALRKGTTLFIAAATDREGLEKLLKNGFKGNFAEASSKADVEVPMWLDRWDKFGFRFYYRPWELPSDPAQAKGYDITKEFDFAKSLGRVGLNFWAKPNSVDTAEGLTDEDWWDWAGIGARENQLPVGLQLEGGVSSPVWLLNRFRDETAQKMPQFVGNYYSVAWPGSGNKGWLSWCSQQGKDVQLGVLQDILRRAVKGGNVTSVLEPHGETRHGLHEVFLEYGPVADASYREFLGQKYKEIGQLNAAWKTSFTAWPEVRVPELASFAGWGEGALDLQGKWKIGYEPLADGSVQSPKELRAQEAKQPATNPAPEEWYAETFDDSGWPELLAPGHDRLMFLPRHPAVFRQKFTVAPGWLEARPRVWLYVWDLSKQQGGKVRVVLDGKTVGDDVTDRVVPHWNAYEVTGVLREGTNLLALRLPGSRLAYRVYLSSEEPRQYPDLGVARNAQWVDFSDWMAWSRGQALKRGMEMIRQAAPEQQISLMHPDDYVDQIKQLAVSYGGNFHNTGYMSGFWADFLPSLARGAGLPFTLEPGGPAATLDDLKKFLGLWSTEGLQGIDYFIHIGNIQWNAEMRKHFETELAVVKLIGKTHAPRTEVAALYSDRNRMLMEFPWKPGSALNLGSSYWKWNIRSLLRDRYESDGLTESSFAASDAARYRVIVDTNTSIMDEPLVDSIQEYVKQGGTFVTFMQTGRHTSTQKDAWPIQRLTGYRVTDTGEQGWHPRPLKTVHGNGILTEDWMKPVSEKGLDGLKLERVASDARDLVLWEDGSVAVGMRPLGKGFIIQVGCKFSDRGMGDRIAPVPLAPPQMQALYGLLDQICAWRGVEPIPAKVQPEKTSVLSRHFVSNNGLYDVWVFWNQSNTQPFSGELDFAKEIDAKWAMEVRDGKRIAITARKLSFDVAPLQTRAFLTPRNAIPAAPSEWFGLQRSWWRGTTPVSDKPLPKPPHEFSLDLGKDWAFKPVVAGDVPSELCAPGCDDSGWERMRLGVWNLPDHREVRHAVLRKQFTVPAGWTQGDIGLWLTAWFGRTFMDGGRIWLDGQPLTDRLLADGVTNANPGGALKPGSSHLLAVEIEGKGALNGSRGTAWLWYWPKPAQSQSLAGKWLTTAAGDPFTAAGEVTLPGEFAGMVLRRVATVPAEQQGRRVVINVEGQGPLGMVIVNGHLVSRHHHFIGERWQLDVTPWIRFGEENEFELIASGKAQVRDISLYFFDPATYP